MRTYSKKSILQSKPEITEEVIEIMNLEIFVYLDLIFFSIFLGFILMPLVHSVSLSVMIPVLFFLLFSGMFRIFFRQKSRNM
ncbi:hypothetical protein [Bacillus sp. MUM 13]|uniref:hypothetical protein n=1 Tax=Bacillus sp. MUM 13 TaxID=1678001 RepID=UPI0008F57745|nr:hypothetical protein [Bacillus sp. MUM 13]OIK07455.1 hypothetical protein BIV59_21035 [Bacillus sp. MUM 13]